MNRQSDANDGMDPQAKLAWSEIDQQAEARGGAPSIEPEWAAPRAFLERQVEESIESFQQHLELAILSWRVSGRALQRGIGAAAQLPLGKDQFFDRADVTPAQAYRLLQLYRGYPSQGLPTEQSERKALIDTLSDVIMSPPTTPKATPDRAGKKPDDAVTKHMRLVAAQVRCKASPAGVAVEFALERLDAINTLAAIERQRESAVENRRALEARTKILERNMENLRDENWAIREDIRSAEQRVEHILREHNQEICRLRAANDEITKRLAKLRRGIHSLVRMVEKHLAARSTTSARTAKITE
jgi:cell division protein FtsB